MKKAFTIALPLALVGLALLGYSQAQQPKQPQQPPAQPTTDAFMQVKLQRTQKVVEGLALEDFDLISRSAQGLMLMSNESNWNVFQTVEYNRLSGEFRDSAARLKKAAKDKNLDGATLAYFEVTLNCVRCHKYTRAQK